MLKQYLEVGQVVGTRGLNGELKVQSWCDTPEILCNIKRLYWDVEGNNKLDIKSLKTYKSILLMEINEVYCLESASKFIKKKIYARRVDIPIDEGSFFIQDLEGIDVIDAKSDCIYGKLSEVIKTGSNDVYKVVNSSGKEYLVPAIEDIVNKIDIESKKILITPIRGIFDNEN